MESSLQLTKQIIILLGFIIAAAFEKRGECDNCTKVDYFPFVEWKVLETDYYYQALIHLVLIAWAFVVYWEDRKNKWLLVAFMLIMGYGLNFIFRANFRFFTLYGYPFGYTAFAALIFSICIFLQVMNGLSRLRR